MLTQTTTQQVSLELPELKTCIEGLTEDEVRMAIAYMMASSNQTIVFHCSPSPRMLEMMLCIDLMNQRTKDKLSLYLIQRIVPKRPSRIREGRYQGKLNR